ncbi:MAG: ribonuclease E activity regulator RraA [Candidatus Competibacteraceae bacterium]|jgi:regulator of ribonuclease activity A|nr:ribonuclease E activity regulator RraA [Candidatus Competibacteraceae bacterium]
MEFKTTDLCDAHAERLQIADPILQDFGGRISFCGPCTTLKVFEDDALVRTTLEEPGQGRVLVVDGGGSMRCALLDALMAEQAHQNGWHGLVVNGCIRDAATLAKLNFGIKALAVHPLHSVKHGVGEQDVPLRFANVHFVPGHYVYADEDGLVVCEEALI